MSRIECFLGPSFLMLCLMIVPIFQATASVTYELGAETDLLDDAFFAGQPEDGTDVAGRMAGFGYASNDGKKVAFWGADAAWFGCAIFVVDIGDPSSWRRLTEYDYGTPGHPIRWTPDDSALYVYDHMISVATGESRHISIHGFWLFRPSATCLPSGNWLMNMRYIGPDEALYDIMALPILPNGEEDSSRSAVQITALAGAHIDTDWPYVSADATMITFHDFTSSVDGISADTGDIYVLKNVQAILNAPKIGETDVSTLAPTTASDPNLVAVRTGESSNGAFSPTLSADKSLVLYEEDWNNAYRAADFWETLPLSDWDVMISSSDGSGDDVRLQRTDSQVVPTITAGGSRIIYCHNESGRFRVYITTLTVITDISGETTGSPEDNDIVTDTQQQMSDASGTTVAIPAGTTVNFPGGVAKEIQISTPVDPATDPQLPAGVDAIPVIRAFGPEGTQFGAPITVTITYSDAEIRGLTESNLRVFLYNAETDVFDTEVTTIVGRDLVNNTISFTIDHFSQYGVGGGEGYGQPVPVVGLLGVFGIAAGLSLLGRRSIRRR